MGETNVDLYSAGFWSVSVLAVLVMLPLTDALAQVGLRGRKRVVPDGFSAVARGVRPGRPLDRVAALARNRAT